MTEHTFISRLEEEGCWVPPDWRYLSEHGEALPVYLRRGMMLAHIYVTPEEVFRATEETVSAVVGRLRFELSGATIH